MSNDEAMGDFLREARSILDKIEMHQEVHAQQLETYEKMINNSILLHKERMDSFEKRWSGTRNVLIALLSLFLLSFISDKIALDARPTTEEITKTLDNYMPAEDIMRGFGAVVDEIYSTFETAGDITHDESDELIIQAKRAIQREVYPNYVERSVKK